MEKIDGKIILVDDQKYENDLIQLALYEKEWDVEVEYFMNPKEALKYFKHTKDKIFLVISDMHMPQMSGLDLKKAIDIDPVASRKSIPFIFFSTSASNAEVTQAYSYRVQGYFKKPLHVKEQAAQLDIIINYWIIARHPNKDSIL
jgi:CheY-like chemotaxis protein